MSLELSGLPAPSSWLATIVATPRPASRRKAWLHSHRCERYGRLALEFRSLEFLLPALRVPSPPGLACGSLERVGGQWLATPFVANGREHAVVT